MKRLQFLTLSLFFFLSAGLLVSCGDQSSGQTKEDSSKSAGHDSMEAAPDDESLTVIEFETMTHDFGKVIEGEKREFVYNFTNTGTNPLVIKNVKPSCGCTTPEWSKDPVAPGAKGIIKVHFDSSNKPGQLLKSVTVISNTKEKVHKLEFTALVEKQ